MIILSHEVLRGAVPLFAWGPPSLALDFHPTLLSGSNSGGSSSSGNNSGQNSGTVPVATVAATATVAAAASGDSQCHFLEFSTEMF